MLKISTALIAFLSFCLFAGLGTSSHAEFFSNIGGGAVGSAGPDPKNASSQALESIGTFVLGLSRYEQQDTTTAKKMFDESAQRMDTAAALFDKLSSDQTFQQNPIVPIPQADLDYLGGPAAQIFGLNPVQIQTQADVLGLTSKALAATAQTIRDFNSDPGVGKYSLVRQQLGTLLWVGEKGSMLLHK